MNAQEKARIRTAWEEGMRRRYEEITGRRVAGSGVQLQKEAARGLMRFLLERSAAQRSWDKKNKPQRKALEKEAARTLGINAYFVSQVTNDVRVPGMQAGSSYSAQCRIGEKAMRITGRPLAAQDRHSTKAAVRAVVLHLVEQHRNDVVRPSRTELSRQAADLLGTGRASARALIRNLALPWTTPRGPGKHGQRARLIAAAFRKSTGRELTRKEIEAAGGNATRAAVRGIVRHLAEQHDQIGMPPKLSKRVGRLLNMPAPSTNVYLTEIRQEKTRRQRLH